MAQKKGIFGLFGKKEEEEKKAPPPAAAPKPDPDKARADRFMEQKERMEKAKEVTKYTVVAGDSLSAIAKKFYDDAGAYMKIYEANKDVIGDNPDLIQPGMELVIPK